MTVKRIFRTLLIMTLILVSIVCIKPNKTYAYSNIVSTGEGSVNFFVSENNYSFAIKTDKTLWTAGNFHDRNLIWSQNLSEVNQVFIAEYSTFIVKTDGTLWATGGNSSGQFGDGTTNSSYTWKQILTNVKQVSAGYHSPNSGGPEYNTFAIKTDGTLWATGGNSLGQFGDGTSNNSYTWKQVLTNVESVSTSIGTSFAVKKDGTLWATGDNGSGQFGVGNRNDSYTWKQVMTDVKSVTVANGTSFAIKTDGTLWGTGENPYGIDYSTKTWNQVLTDVVDVSTNTKTSFAVRTDGTLWATGKNSSGEYGDGTTTVNSLWGSAWREVLSNVSQVTQGGINESATSFAVKKDGTLWATGNNSSGQFGDGTKNSSRVWKQVFNLIAVDLTPPNLTLIQNSTSWTNNNISIVATASDAQSGVKNIKLPDGNFTNGSIATYTVNNNGVYTFVAYDNNGNANTQTITINNIDKTPPTATSANIQNQDENGYDVYVYGVGDSQSGVNRVQFPTWTDYTTNGNSQDDIQPNWWSNPSAYGTNLGNGTWKYHVNKSSHNNEMGKYNTHIYIYDNVGNYKCVATLQTTLIVNDDATITSNDIPDTMESGKVYTVHVTAKNTGGKTWDNNYRLGAVGDSDPFATTRQYLSNNVTPGQSYTFTFNMTTPKTSGTYATDWRMVHEGVQWFGTTTSKNINVVDTTKPTITLTPNTTNWTTSVIININSADIGSGVKNIKLPDGNYVTDNTSQYTVFNNGEYSFESTDNARNTAMKTISINNIDKIAPTGTITQNPISWTNGNVTLTVIGSDSQSGVKSITKPDGTIVNGDNISYIVNTNKAYDFIFTDNVGNTVTKSYTVTNIDKTLPTLKLTLNSDLITNKTVTINAKASDEESGIQSITKPNGSVVNGNTASYIVDKNDTYIFKATDVAGNVVTVNITVNNIIDINTVSGIDHIEYKLEGATVQDWTTYNSLAIVNEGITTIYARAVDKAGNYSDIVTSVVKLDRSAPINTTIKITN